MLRARLVERAKDPDVAAFKSIVCSRTGLGVSIVSDSAAEIEALRGITLQARNHLNDLVVRTTVEVAAEHNKLV